ncbi:MAG: putative toxin-antitoxin system toxin component, PIN family, partial [Planctomycetes bacterium]|nr:putative toxin-antitoxin system toxin component, PIN family [Planctomycetota bacterium]
MITAVVGTNVFLRGAISGSRRSASKDLLNAFFAGRFVLLLSSETFEEIQRVLAQDDVRAMHGWTDEKLLRFCRALEVRAKFREPAATVPASLTRDETDTKWVALALAGNADY